MEKSELISKALHAENNNNWIEALGFYQDLLRLDFSINYLSKVGWCYSRLSDFDNSIEYFKKCSNIEPNKAQWYYMIGYQYYSQSCFLESVQWFEKSIELYPSYLIAKYRLSYAYIKIAGTFKQLTKAEFWRAIDHLKSCHELWKSYNNEEKTKNKSTYFDICSLHGKTLSSLDNYLDTALHYLLMAHSIKSDDNNMYQIAKLYFKKGDFKSSLIYLPKTNKYYFRELDIDIEIEMKNYDLALKKVNNLLSFRKKDYIYIKKAKIYFNKKEYKEAYRCVSSAININPNNHINHFSLAKIYYVLNLYNRAYKEFEISNNLKIKKFGEPLKESLQAIEYITKNKLTEIEDNEVLLKELEEKSNNYGHLKKYNEQKGFGFIDSNGSSIFFHISNCSFKNVIIGKTVFFELENNKKGLHAINIKYV